MSFPIEEHPSWEILDSSKIQDFQDCPRKFFFSHLLGWRQEEKNIHLTFGTAWHEGMEAFADHRRDPDVEPGYPLHVVAEAADRFLKSFESEYGTDVSNDASFGAKSRSNGVLALEQYAKAWDRDKFTTLYTEIAGSVPISDSRLIHFKLDTVISDDYVWSLEHKTSGRNTEAWRGKWGIMTQIGTYTHVVRCIAPEEMVKGVQVNGAFIYKSQKNDFLRLPIVKSNEMMMMWLWETNHWVDLIYWNLEQLQESDPEEPVMRCFPINATSCGKFGCSYPGICESWNNPLRHCSNVPLGYEKRFWDPREREEVADLVVHQGSDGSIEMKKREEV